jgi:hypothetical protein
VSQYKKPEAKQYGAKHCEPHPERHKANKQDCAYDRQKNAQTPAPKIVSDKQAITPPGANRF